VATGQAEKKVTSRDFRDRMDMVLQGNKQRDELQVFKDVLKESENIMKQFFKQTILEYFKYLKNELPGILLDDYRAIEEAFNPDIMGRTLDLFVCFKKLK
jgi:hypothetical protein